MNFEQAPVTEGQPKVGTSSIAGWVLAVMVSLGTLLLSYPFFFVIAGFSQDAPNSDIDVAMMMLAAPAIIFIVGIILAVYKKKRLWLFLPHMMIGVVLVLSPLVSIVWSLLFTLFESFI